MAQGEELFKLACKRDLEGIVAKQRFGPYLQELAQWLKIRNPMHSHLAGREKVFELEREFGSDLSIWDSCAVAWEQSASEHSS